MFGFLKRRTSEKIDHSAQETGAKIANSFLETIQTGRYAIPVIAFKKEEAEKFSQRSIESQLSNLTPEELSLLFEMLNFQLSRMEKAVKVYDKFQENMLKLADEGLEKGSFPKEIAEKIKTEVGSDTGARKNTYAALLKIRDKIKPMRDMTVAFVENATETREFE